MTYKGTNWTRGDLGHAPDRNPAVDCPHCGESYWYQDYWKPRYVDGKDWNPREITWLCDDCLDAARRDYEQHKKRQLNATITEY